MDAELELKVERFRKLPRELRLQALLGHAKRFPELPDELRAARDRGLGRVAECQTPLYLWIGLDNGKVRIHADAPRDAPTVRGFVGFLVEALDGAESAAVVDLPEDLMDRMGLTDVLGVQRTRGLGSVIRRIRRDVARAAEVEGPSGSGDPPERRGAD
jgi:cysteine desulfuration protein SufE